MKQIRVVLQQAEPPPSLLAASRARSGYGLVGAASRPPGDDDEPSLDARILAIAAPSLLALALDPVLAAVDVAFVGRCGARSGAAPLAAVAASTGFFGFVFSATNSFTSAGTPLVAKARADDGDAAALRLGGAVVRAAAVVGVGLMLASEAAAPAAMRVFAPDGVESASVAFTRLRAASAPAVVGAAALNGALRGVVRHLGARRHGVHLLLERARGFVDEARREGRKGRGRRRGCRGEIHAQRQRVEWMDCCPSE